jgi:hypothetical protein
VFGSIHSTTDAEEHKEAMAALKAGIAARDPATAANSAPSGRYSRGTKTAEMSTMAGRTGTDTPTIR